MHRILQYVLVVVMSVGLWIAGSVQAAVPGGLPLPGKKPATVVPKGPPVLGGKLPQSQCLTQTLRRLCVWKFCLDLPCPTKQSCFAPPQVPQVQCLPDSDQDGIQTAKDNCPLLANKDQLDSDTDGVGNACDNCATVANPQQQDIDTSGVGDACEYPQRMSVDSSGAEGDGTSRAPALSADGRYVVFASWAMNFVSGDTNQTADVFVHDRQTTTTTRVSVGAAMAGGDKESWSPAVSADGRYVAFRSRATNLVPGDTNGKEDVFVHDRQTTTTTRVNVGPAGAESAGDLGDVMYELPAVSADGRYVVFQSGAPNLVPGDANGKEDVFVHDRQTTTTTRVSVGPSGVEGDGDSEGQDVSADGRYVVFASGATNFVPGDTNQAMDVFMHDRQTATTTRVSVGPMQAEGDGYSWHPAVSDDGLWVAFDSVATNLVPSDTNQGPNVINGGSDVFMRNLRTVTTTRVNVSTAGIEGKQGLSSGRPSLSADGRYVVFKSWDSNLVPNDTNGKEDVFVHDRQTGQTTLVSVSSTGAVGNGESVGRAISADGRYIAFASEATNLIPGDTNGAIDIFLTTNPLWIPPTGAP